MNPESADGRGPDIETCEKTETLGALETLEALEALEARILRLESDHAYHQAALAAYDEQFYRYEQRISRLEETFGRIVSAMKELADAKQGPLPPGERPPHY